MTKSVSTAPTALSAAVAAWNNKTRESAAPVLRHVQGSIRALQRLRDSLRDLDGLASLPRTPEVYQEDGPLPEEGVVALRALCGRLDRLELALGRLGEEAEFLAGEGAALMADFRTFAPCDTADPAHQLHLAPVGEIGGERRGEDDVRALDRLIAAQKAEIDALHRQLSEAEAAVARVPAPPQPELPRLVSQVELQSVQEFIQNSPIASIPVNASYYERILEVAASPEGHRVPMGKILTGAGVVTPAQLEHALAHQKQGRRKALGTLLVELGYTTEKAIAQALAAQLALPYVVLENEGVDPRAVAAVPLHLARRHAAMPLTFSGHSLCVAMANPLDLIALEDLRIAANTHIRPCVAARGEIGFYIDRHYG